MPQRVSIQQAAANALAEWLREQLPDVTVEARWPEPNVPLPPKAITVLLAGSRIDEPLDPQVLHMEPIDAARARYRWRVAACTQPLQLDAWTTSDVERDDLLSRLDECLRAGPSRTLDWDWNGDPVANGLELKLGDGWQDTIAAIDFEAPHVHDTPNTVQQREYRATFRGEARVHLYVEAESPRMAVIRLRQRLSEAGAPASSLDVVTVTADASKFAS